MRGFVIIERGDGRKIVSYVLFLVIVTFLSTLLLRLSIDSSRQLRMEVARLKPDRYLEPVDDYYDFPCYRGLIPSQQLRWQSKCVRSLHKGVINPGILFDERCQLIPIEKKPSICTYKPLGENEPIYYNSEALEHKTHIDIMLKVLDANPKMHFLDIGENEGAYCIAASSKSRNTICMNGNYRTLKVLWKSLVINRQPDNAQFIWNILVDKPETWIRKLYDVSEEIRPLNQVESSPNSSFNLDVVRKQRDYIVNGVTLNDLTGLFRNRDNCSVFMKLDMDSIEVSAFFSGDRFFHFTNVRIIQILTSFKEKAVAMTELLGHQGFQAQLHPYGDILDRRKIDIWPKNIYFIK